MTTNSLGFSPSPNFHSSRTTDSTASLSHSTAFSEPIGATDSFGSVTKTRSVELKPSLLDTKKMSLDVHDGPLEDYKSFVVLDVEYGQVKALRKEVMKAASLTKPLKYLKDIRKEGEAHVTAFTPVEAQKIVTNDPEAEPNKLTMKEISSLAKEVDISQMDLDVKGFGSGSRVLNGNLEQTFFLIVDSKKLRAFRESIQTLYVSKGGQPEDFQPEKFYPHITIGYTERDLHEGLDGVIKDLEHSRDDRLKVTVSKK